jgi:hypothetical protein
VVTSSLYRLEGDVSSDSRVGGHFNDGAHLAREGSYQGPQGTTKVGAWSAVGAFPLKTMYD